MRGGVCTRGPQAAVTEGAVLAIVVLVSFSVLSLSALHDASVGGCPRGYYGYNCRHHCHCADEKQCDVTAHCYGVCADGWSGPTCQSQDIAFGMPSKIRTRDPTLSSWSAVDGNSSTCVTSDPESAAGWFRVDLQDSRSVYHLTLTTGGVSARGWQVFVTTYSDFYWATPCATVRSDRPHVRMTCDSPSSGRYVTVLNTEGPVTVCDLQVHVCAAYTWGADCGKLCQCSDASEVCHPLTGHCTTGCRPGFSGRQCQQPCNMTYGSNCVTPCGQCSRGQVCHPVTGLCPAGCRPGWSGSHCNARCPRGRYGAGCTQRCGGCLDDEACASDTGLCPGQCRTGRHGPRCQQDCEEGRHGPSCQFQCGHCLPDHTCDATTGICPRGCDVGWEGLFCTQECLPHRYGLNCRHKCDHCLTSCDSRTGLCDVNGCSAGRIGQYCEQDCPAGFYGVSCSQACGHCLEGSGVCDVITGHCPGSLCQPGWVGQACDTPCRVRMYGVNCSLECGACDGSDVCNHVTGICPGPCQKGFYGDKCQQLSFFLDTTSETSVALIATILTIALVVVAIVCVCLALKWRRDKTVALQDL